MSVEFQRRTYCSNRDVTVFIRVIVWDRYRELVIKNGRRVGKIYPISRETGR
jgi:hypothetical protein